MGGRHRVPPPRVRLVRVQRRLLALGIAFVLAGVGIGCAETAQSAAVAKAAPAELRGSAFGLLAAIQSFGNLAAGAVAGVLWTLVSPRAGFIYLAAWMLVAVLALFFPSRRSASFSAPTGPSD